MRILLIEDEKPAAEWLQSLLRELYPLAEVVATFDSVRDTVKFFRAGKSVDLIFLDIQLTDGQSFEIFDHVTIDTPIIFTTAHIGYALQAFRYQSIAYILKPIQKSDVKNAVEKFKNMTRGASLQLTVAQLDTLKKLLAPTPSYKKRLLVKAGNKLQLKPVEEISYFFAEGKDAYAVPVREKRKHLINYTLEELSGILCPEVFFRVSRKFIVNIQSIAEVKGQVSKRLEVKLNQSSEHAIVVSRDKAQEFKNWLDQ